MARNVVSPLKFTQVYFRLLFTRSLDICFVNNFHVGTNARQFTRVLPQNADTNAVARHQQIKEIVICRKAVDQLKSTVLVRYRVFLEYRCAASPQYTTRKELPHVIHIIVQCFCFFYGSQSKRTIVFYYASDCFSPELSSAQIRQKACICAGKYEGSKLLHRVGHMLVLAEKLLTQQTFFPLAAHALTLLLL